MKIYANTVDYYRAILTDSFVNQGHTSMNTAVIREGGGTAAKSWIPDNALNEVTGYTKGMGYEIICMADMDVPAVELCSDIVSDSQVGIFYYDDTPASGTTTAQDDDLIGALPLSITRAADEPEIVLNTTPVEGQLNFNNIDGWIEAPAAHEFEGELVKVTYKRLIK